MAQQLPVEAIPATRSLTDWEAWDVEAGSGWPSTTAFRDLLKQSQVRVKQAFLEGTPASELIHARAKLMDELLSRAWGHHLGTYVDQLALVAVGGYGRGELHPGSDVDILVIIPDACDGWQSQVEAFLTFLWDIGLDIGQSVRTVAECAGKAACDITIITNLLEARLIRGAEHLFEAMRAAISPRRMWSSEEFFQAKWEEQALRHRKYHDTGYQLEPNVKESPGGLRDIQVIVWVAKRHFQAQTLEQLVEYGFLTAAEYRSLCVSQEFLWKVRLGLHIIAGRREDRLLFDNQLQLAKLLGYTDADHNLAVEQFMQQYYRTVKRISRLNEMLLQLFQENILYPQDQEPPQPINARFQTRRGYIEVRHDKVFVHRPYALLEIFLLLELDPQIKGVRASTIRLIRQHRNLIDDKFRADIRARSLFMEILRQPRGITHELRRMNNYGILARYLPSFGQIVGRMQFDLFHVFTVDQHILFVIRNLRRLTLPQFEHEFPLCSQIMARIAKQELLYLGALFHDIAKGRGGDHSSLGSSDAESFCRLHGLSERDTQLVSWLVRNHLLMSMTAQRRDISDPQVIHEFAAAVGNQTRLDYLFLLTVADLRGTNPDLLTSWKYSLLSELYHSTREALLRGLDNPLDTTEIIQENQEQALTLLARTGLSMQQTQTIWAAFPQEYFLRHQGEEIAWETGLIATHTGVAEPLVRVRLDPSRGGTAILVYTPDRDYLFGLVSGVLNQLRLTVQDARINSTTDNHALNTYIVLEENGAPLRESERMREIEHKLSASLAQNEPAPLKVNRRRPRQTRAFHTPTQVHFSWRENPALTIVELITDDRPGLLATVGRIFQQQGIRLHTAKIATIGEHVEDVFFITDTEHAPLTQPERLEQLQQALCEALDKDENQA